MRTMIFGLLALAATNLTRAGAAAPADGSDVPGVSRRVRWASAPPAERCTYRVGRMKDNPTIDADWDRPAWKGVAPVTLEYYMGDEPAHQPRVQARMAYDDRFLYVIWKVEDRFVLARRTKHQQDVCRDSCVELFFTPGGAPEERGYFNLETNCAGVKLFGAHVVGDGAGAFTTEDFAGIATASSLKGPIDREIAGPTSWTLEYRIPLELLEKHAKVERPGPGVTWRANFYKCADESSRPHWLTWSPVTNARPSFHLPRYFGILAFE